MIYKIHDFTVINWICCVIHRCDDFNKIVPAKPALFIPQQVIGFYLFRNVETKDDISTATFQLTLAKCLEPVVNVFHAIVKAFNINDAYDIDLNNIALTYISLVRV